MGNNERLFKGHDAKLVKKHKGGSHIYFCEDWLTLSEVMKL